jgi:hypothetical protein
MCYTIMACRSRKTLKSRRRPSKKSKNRKCRSRGGFKIPKRDALSRKTCTEVFKKGKGYSKSHNSACKWLRPDLYKETQKGVFDWTRREKTQDKKGKVIGKSSAAVVVSYPKTVPTVLDADSRPIETEITPAETVVSYTSSDQDISTSTAPDTPLSESSVSSRPVSETLRTLDLEDGWLVRPPSIGHSGGNIRNHRKSNSSKSRKLVKSRR